MHVKAPDVFEIPGLLDIKKLHVLEVKAVVEVLLLLEVDQDLDCERDLLISLRDHDKAIPVVDEGEGVREGNLEI